MCIALASHSNVEIYFLHVPSVSKDDDIRTLFKGLPTQCFVVLEDIDAIGLRDTGYSSRAKKCTFSGLLNVIDGIGSHEGRIILMTTNFIDRLDPALIRPGRIDKRVYLGKLGQRAAKEMFLRLFEADEGTSETATSRDVEKLDSLAEDFSRKLPAEMFTPAQVQGYLLEYRGFPEAAVAGVKAWAEKKALEKSKREEEREVMKKAKAEEDKKKKSEQKSMVQLIRSVIREERGKTDVKECKGDQPDERPDEESEEALEEELDEELDDESSSSDE